MKATLNLDDKRMQEIMKITGEKNKTEIVNNALDEYLKKLNRDSIKEAYGKFNFDLNVREFRNLEFNEM
jgi:hypothetical protein